MKATPFPGLDHDLRTRILERARAGDCEGVIRLVEACHNPAVPAAASPKALSVEDAATALGVSVRTVWRQVGLGHLDTVRIGRRTLISTASLDRLVQAGGCR